MPTEAHAERDAPSAFFLEHAARLKATRPLGPTLDLACGSGRHSLAAADFGLSVVALDRDATRLAALVQSDPEPTRRIRVIEADLEADVPPPLETAHFGAVLVFRYLHRPLMPWIASLLAPGGRLLYETFTVDQRRLGWGPKSDDFLLRHGELPGAFPELEIEIYEEGLSHDARPAATGRLLARRPD